MTQKLRGEQDSTSNQNVLAAFWGTLVLADLAILGVAIANGSVSRTLFVGLLVAAAAGMAGALLGFLFGLPRGAENSVPATQSRPNVTGETTTTNATSPVRPGGRANNNLLEISDWLTKIIVGAGLVGLQDLVVWSGGVSQMIGEGAGLRTMAEARVFGGATLAFFFGWGFLFVYIQTRTIITRVFADTERSLSDIVKEAVADKVQDAFERVTPELANITVGAIMNLLYNSPQDAAEQARSYLKTVEGAADARVWGYLACACGQLHKTTPDPAERTRLREEALAGIKRCLELDPTRRNWVRGLIYVDDPNHLEGDDDLSDFRGDKDFQELVGPPPDGAQEGNAEPIGR